MKKKSSAPDLAKHPPRSPRVRLGGYVILPRMLDKGRATLAGTQGEYCFACPLDQEFLQFAGVNAEALRHQLSSGKGDGEILEWLKGHAKYKRTASAIAAWSAWQEQRPPTTPAKREYFNNLHKEVAPNREDIASWFDLLDVDDYVSFGGRA